MTFNPIREQLYDLVWSEPLPRLADPPRRHQLIAPSLLRRFPKDKRGRQPPAQLPHPAQLRIVISASRNIRMASKI
jgi:hypothetical protein